MFYCAFPLQKFPIYKKNIIHCKGFNHPEKPQPSTLTLEIFLISPKIFNPL